MSLQLAEIVLYAHDGRTRSLPFTRGTLNILTGPPLRGKSQLIEIIDYCLGRGSATLAPGPITECVSWFALRLYLSKGEAFIARRAGHGGKKTSEEIFFDRAATISPPPLTALRATHNLESLIAELDGVLGIQHNEIKVAETSGREPFMATARHASLLCFQAQHEIANPSHLFHRQSEDQGAVGRDLLATLPYFLGAISPQLVTIESEATRVRRELRVAERSLREEELLSQDRRSRADALYAEAVAVGVATEVTAWQNYDQLLAALTQLTNWSPRSTALQPSGDAYQRALRERSAAIRELQTVRRDIEEARAYAAEQSAFVAELQEQRGRLTSINLYAHLAGQDLIPLTNELREELAEVEREVEAAILPTSDLGGYIEALEQRRADLLATVQRSGETLDALSSQVESLRQLRDSDLRQAAVVGRVSLFVESIRHTASTTPTSQRVSRLRVRLGQLEEQIDDLDLSSNLSEVLGQIGGLMKAWATEVGHEYQDATWRLDLRHGTVVTRGSRGTVTMGGMGGGKNHLGCHLFAHMALHSWLRGNSAPTPGFMFFDRPTTGLYEAARKQDANTKQEIGPEGQQHISRLLRWIESIVSGLGGTLQVIVTENLKLIDDPAFKPHVIEDWWANDGYLVPTDWTPVTPDH